MGDSMWTWLTELFKRPKYVACAMVAAFLVWGFAHFTAEPGGQVNTLWGMTSYSSTVVICDSHHRSNGNHTPRLGE
jgi:hypothetical protein